MSYIRRLEKCSLNRLNVMRRVISDEIAIIDNKLIKCEDDFKELAQKSYTVKLDKQHGHYQLTVDKIDINKEKLIKQKDELIEKDSLIEEAWQKKYLFENQVKKLGSRKKVLIKDWIVFFLILLVIAILTIDLLGLGAPGNGAILEPEIDNGKLIGVNIISSGEGYESVNFSVKDKTGNGALFVGRVIEGKLSSVEVINTGQEYENPSVVVHPYFANKTLIKFWFVDLICCVLFLFNFFFELKLASSKKWYWKRNWIDFITSIPIPPIQVMAASSDLGIIRMGRLLRAIRILRGLRSIRILLFLWRGMDHLSSTMDVKLLKRSLLYAVLSIFAGAILFMSIEQMESGSGFIESLWWSFTTLVTGGYADIHNPETPFGRILTIFLVITGMILVGIFTATLTSVLVEDNSSLDFEDVEEQTNMIINMSDKIKNVDDRLDKMEDAIQEIKKLIISKKQQ